ncbi:hypothetical protein ACFSAV_00570 [Pasteurella oralis]|uniref:Uncharacterized protein n=1 Tax=Pasteurella oralis TaxID=1071947 RepID=A0ABW4NUY8_9PAST
MKITTWLKTTLLIGALLNSTNLSANAPVYVESPSIENVSRASSYVSYMYRIEALRNQWVGNDAMFFIRLSSIDTFGDTRSALIASLSDNSYSIERIATNCNTKETTLKSKAVYDANAKLIESNQQNVYLGRPIPDSYITEAVLVMCDALAIIPANPSLHDDKMKESVPFMNIINDHVRRQGVKPHAIIVDHIDDYLRTRLNAKKSSK